MAAAAYRHLVRQLEDADLFRQADLVREAMATPGWAIVEQAIAEHRRKMLDQLLLETTKAEEIPRLRGLVSGLASMEEAGESIVAYAREREADALKAQEKAHA